MAIPICRVCGLSLSLDIDCKALEDYLQIYSQLTAIRVTPRSFRLECSHLQPIAYFQLDDDKDLHEMKVCNICVRKLKDFDQFRNVCLQVHWRLLNVVGLK